MIQIRRLLIATGTAFLSVACGVDHMQGADVSALAGSIESARVEVTRHEDAVTSATTLEELPTEVDRHERNMGGILDTMSTRMGGMMSHCSGSGMNAMHDGMVAITSEMRSYRDTMIDAATLATAQSECTTHAHRVDGMLDGMGHALDSVGCTMMGR